MNNNFNIFVSTYQIVIFKNLTDSKFWLQYWNFVSLLITIKKPSQNIRKRLTRYDYNNYFHKTTTSEPDAPYYHIIKLIIEGLISCPEKLLKAPTNWYDTNESLPQTPQR